MLQVKESWTVVGLDLMGPLQDTEHKMSYIMTLTDLFSKFVVADALPSKCGYEVAKAITAKFYLFGPAKKIITDRGKEFVNEVCEVFVSFFFFFWSDENS